MKHWFPWNDGWLDGWLPHLLLRAVMDGADFKAGVAAAVPGWENVRLLAPHAELRLLACGQSSLIDADRLRCVQRSGMRLVVSDCIARQASSQA